MITSTEETVTISKSQIAEILAGLHTCQDQLVMLKESRRICCESEQAIRCEANRLRTELQSAQKACAEMRLLVGLLECKCDTASLGGYTCPRCHALSSDCGSGWHSPEEWNKREELVNTLTAALEKLAKLGNEPMPGNSIGNRIAQEALEAVRPQSP